MRIQVGVKSDDTAQIYLRKRENGLQGNDPAADCVGRSEDAQANRSTDVHRKVCGERTSNTPRLLQYSNLQVLIKANTI